MLFVFEWNLCLNGIKRLLKVIVVIVESNNENVNYTYTVRVFNKSTVSVSQCFSTTASSPEKCVKCVKCVKELGFILLPS